MKEISTKFRISLGFKVLVLLCFMQAISMAQDVSYQSVKSDVDLYGNADDLMDENLLEARSRVRELPPKAVPYLMRLFVENSANSYRSAIVDAFEHNDSSYSMSAPFIFDQLQGPVDEWNGQTWVAHAMDFLWKANPDSAFLIAKKAVGSDDLIIRTKALKILEMRDERPEASSEAGDKKPPPLPATNPTGKQQQPTAQKAQESTTSRPLLKNDAKSVQPPAFSSSKRWPLVMGVIVLGLGLLWAVLKLRK